MTKQIITLATTALLFAPACAVDLNLRTTFAKHDYAHTEGDWSTRVSRPWGTSRGEYYIDTSQEAGGIVGDGMSDNLAQTIGEDAGIALIETAGDVLAPVSGAIDLVDEEGD